MATDLKALQNRLNSDQAFRSQFLKDPAGTLETAGLILPDDAKDSLKDLVAQLTTKPQQVAGSTLDEVGSLNIMMNIQIK